jgi:threonine dehydrogenase-like Zn-dependent dehydrogenase
MTSSSATLSPYTDKKMQAAVLSGPGVLQITEIDLPEPGPGEVRVRLEGAGVCGSNLEVWSGQPWFQYPMESGAPGHEGWGRVDAIGDEVSDLAPGDRVAFLSGHAFAEYDIAKADQTVKLPGELDGKPFPGEALGCAMNISRRSDIRAGQTVAIVGIGFLGALLTQLAGNVGARVIAISRRQYALDIAKRFGADEAIPMDDNGSVIEAVRGITNGQMCERVIEVVGKQQPLDLAAELCAERGRLIIAGYHQDGPREVNMWLWNWRGLDVINAHERDPNVYVEGIRAAVDAVVQGVIDPTPLYSDTFRLADLGKALDHVRDRPDGFVKALVTI